MVVTLSEVNGFSMDSVDSNLQTGSDLWELAPPSPDRDQRRSGVVYSSTKRLEIRRHPSKKRLHDEASFCVHSPELNVLLVCFIWFLNVLFSWTWTSLDVDICLDDTSLWIYNWSTWMPCCLILVFCFFVIDFVPSKNICIYFYNYSLKNFLKINKNF